MEYKLIIKGTLPSLNDYIKQLNISKFRGAELKRQSERYIALFIKKQLRGVEIINPVNVEFTWIEPNKNRDKDNTAFAKKFIFDALVVNGVLKNDGWAQIDGFSDKFAIDRANPRIEIIIKEAV